MSGIPEPALATRRLARLIVERHNLQPPVDIRSLCGEYASIKEVRWPNKGVDALVYRSSSDDPIIILREDSPERRKRFTVGHELGHVLIPWHIGDLTCVPSYEVMELNDFGAEQQADIFSSGILLPDRWMADLLVDNGEHMAQIISALNLAQVSPMAALLALKRNLFAGWAFCLCQSSGVQTVLTPGTRLDPLEFSRQDALRRTSLDSGSAVLQGKTVEWYRLRDVAEMPSGASEQSDATAMLRLALAEYSGSAAEQLRHEQILNGKVGGVLRQAEGRPARELFATLEYRLQQDGYADLLAIPDFREWLASKAISIERGSTKSKLRRGGR